MTIMSIYDSKEKANLKNTWFLLHGFFLPVNQLLFIVTLFNSLFHYGFNMDIFSQLDHD